MPNSDGNCSIALREVLFAESYRLVSPSIVSIVAHCCTLNYDRGSFGPHAESAGMSAETLISGRAGDPKYLCTLWFSHFFQKVSSTFHVHIVMVVASP